MAYLVLAGGVKKGRFWLALILVVDDESDVRYVLRKLLERQGHTVVEASDGREALRSVAEQLPDLVLTDLMMPVMSGGELICALRDDPVTADIPIVAVSGHRGGHRFPADVAVIAKPFNLRPLLEAVNELLEGRAGR